MKRLTWTVVAGIIHDMGFQPSVSPHGFTLSNPLARLECGSGIAGRGEHWHIVERGGTTTESVTTEKALRRILREWAAGPKPRGARYARMHHNRFGDHYIWVN